MGCSPWGPKEKDTTELLSMHAHGKLINKGRFLKFSSVTQSCPTLCNLRTVALQAPLSMGFSGQEYWSVLPFPPPGDLPYPGIEVASPTSPALADGFLTIGLLGSPV